MHLLLEMIKHKIRISEQVYLNFVVKLIVIKVVYFIIYFIYFYFIILIILFYFSI